MGRIRSSIRKFGWLDGLLYLVDQTLQQLSHGRAYLKHYHFVAQPLDTHAPEPRRLGKNFTVRQVAREDPEAGQFPRPATVIQSRYEQGAICFCVHSDIRFAGFLWFCQYEYLEDEVRCRFVPLPGDSAIWDFDVYIAPEFRNTMAFLKLWNGAGKILRDRGIRWSISRISAFSPQSMSTHRRLGARSLGQAFFLVIGGIQFTVSGLPPYFHVSFNENRIPTIVVQAPP